jgi:hypothetical protein
MLKLFVLESIQVTFFPKCDPFAWINKIVSLNTGTLPDESLAEFSTSVEPTRLDLRGVSMLDSSY